MVSKASDDLPDPLTPVITISDRGGSVTSTFLRLWVRAPRTTIWPRVAVVAMQVENSGRTGTVHVSAAMQSVQPRRGQTVLFCWPREFNPRYKEGAVSVRLFIGNLPYTATEADLREHLSSVGVPTSVVLPVDRETGRPRGFAFVDYADRAVAEEAIKRFDQQPFKGRGLAVSEARPREDRPPGAPRPGGFSSPPPGGYVGARPAGGPGGYGAPPRPSGFRGPRPSDGACAAPRGTQNFGPD